MASSVKELSDSVNDFTLDIYKHVVKDHTADNVFMSPSNMIAVLAMLHVGARNKTEDQMSKVLKFEKLDKNSLLRKLKTFVSTLKKGSKSVKLKTANRLFPHTEKTILKEYISLVSKHFKADVKSMDYTSKAEAARQKINKWVESETNNKIVNLLPDGSLNSFTAMVVINAIYFKGKWATKFDQRSTGEGIFTKLNAEEIQVQMMHKRMKKVKYGVNRSLACQILELPYKGKELAMVIFLPVSNDGLPALEKQLTPNNFYEMVSDLHPGNVDVFLPKFKLQTSLELKTVLSALGMPDLFDMSSADLSGMGEDLFVSEMYHKAFVDVHEEGTEAAAAETTDVVSQHADVMKFSADHPFMFMIWDHRLKVPIFIGRFAEPHGTK